jgi:hypothetical protein
MLVARDADRRKKSPSIYIDGRTAGRDRELAYNATPAFAASRALRKASGPSSSRRTTKAPRAGRDDTEVSVLCH